MAVSYTDEVVITAKLLVLVDLADLNLPKTCQIEFPDSDDLLNFKLIITPDEVSTVCK